MITNHSDNFDAAMHRLVSETGDTYLDVLKLQWAPEYGWYASIEIQRFEAKLLDCGGTGATPAEAICEALDGLAAWRADMERRGLPSVPVKVGEGNILPFGNIGA